MAKKKPKFEIGKKYVVRMKDERSVDLLRPLTTREHLLFNVVDYLKASLKVLVILVSVCIPPLLLITIPLLKQRGE